MTEISWLRSVGSKRLLILLISSVLIVTIVASFVIAFSSAENVPGDDDDDIIDDCDLFWHRTIDYSLENDEASPDLIHDIQITEINIKIWYQIGWILQKNASCERTALQRCLISFMMWGN